MPKLLRQNVGGIDYNVAGCALTASCSTAAATAAKTAILSDGDILADGMSVAVQFTYGNTAAAPLTLTVGGVTAYICDSRGQNTGGNIWQAGDIVTFLYTHGKFLLLGGALLKNETGSITIPSQTLNNGDNAEVTIPLIPNDFYCGRIDFSDLPSVNLNLSYNDFSGLFQDAKSTESRTQAVLYPIGKASLAILHVYLTNYTGSPITIGDITVNYCLEHHTV